MDYSLFDLYYDSFLVVDKDLKVIYANEAAALLFGTSVRRLMSPQKTFVDNVSFDPLPNWLSSIEDVVDPTPVKEVGFTAGGGKTGKGQITVQKVAESDGHWIIYIRDVTLEETLQKKYRAELDQKEEVIEDLKQARNELENYSKNLEEMVEQRTAEIQKLHFLQTAMFNSLGQGFLVFDESGKCLPTFSKACETILECVPADQKIWDVLKLKESEVEGFQKWMTAIFSEMLPFADLAVLGPNQYFHSQGRHIQLEYHPMRIEEKIAGLVLVASDITAQIQAEEDAKRERAQAQMMVNLIRNKKQLASFIRDTRHFLEDLKVALKDNEPDCELIFRIVHTLKGGAASFSLSQMVEQTHAYEAQLAEVMGLEPQEQMKVIQNLRNDYDLIQQSFDEFLTQNMDLLGPSVMDHQRYLEYPLSHFEDFVEHLPQPKLKRDFREHFVMEKIGDAFAHFDETVQRVALDLGKFINPVSWHGGELKVLPEPYSELFSTFIHVFRNGVDHGIESPDVREQSGKSQAGSIQVRFSHNEGQLTICVEDDGGGIDPEKIRAKLPNGGSGEDDQTVIQHIFDSQLSTREQATDLSGRGVGMDAVKMAAKALGGSAWVESELGRGTRITVSVPYIDTTTTTDSEAA